MKTSWLNSLVLLFCSLGVLNAQQMSKKVSFNYHNEPLGVVLKDISQQHKVRFAYSKNYIPVGQKINVSVKQKPLSQALDLLFEETAVIYKNINGQIVLKVDKRKQQSIGQIETPLPKKVKPLYRPVIEERKKEREARLAMNLPPIDRKVMKELPGGKRLRTFDAEILNLKPIEDVDPELEETSLAQVSLLPFLGTNAFKSRKVVNNVSLNLFWGANGGVDGIEVGGLVNSIKNDVRGVQVAGLGNTVGGNVTGSQVSGLFNASEGKVQGVQVGGLFNLSGPADAVQTAGIFNTAKGNFSGVQVAGLFNTTAGHADGFQVAGLFNTAEEDVETQVSGLMNIAGGDVSFGQFSSLLNYAQKVDGFQIGLINICDSISGTPIGLLNIVKHGYNKVEFSASEVMYGNFALKFGAYSFYNILHLGARWDDVPYVDMDGQEQTGRFISWSLGYGIGTAIRLSPSWLINLEAVSMHVNETEFWTNDLNLLNQLKLSFSVRTGRRSSFFAGPVGNLMFSRRLDEDTGLIGSNIMPYTMLDGINNNLSTKAWIGFNAGIRF
ncbi:MAG: STN domain-containing protein [Saprospiraceae bacterium]|nr:STN domain-containing protein [Saprospiraceae bacterium]